MKRVLSLLLTFTLMRTFAACGSAAGQGGTGSKFCTGRGYLCFHHTGNTPGEPAGGYYATGGQDDVAVWLGKNKIL